MVAALRFICFVFFATIGAYSVHLSNADANYRSLLGIASRLEAGRIVSKDIVSAVSDDILDPSFAAECRSEILRPALTVVLFRLNDTNSALDYSVWAETHAKAKNFIDGMIRCMPSDSNAWLRLAVVSRAVAENANAISQQMALAQRLAPYEAPQVYARLVVWKMLSPYALSVSGTLARADIRATMIYGSKVLLASLKVGMSPQFEALVKREEADLSPNL